MSEPQERIAELEKVLDRVEAFEQTLAVTFADLDKYKRLLGKRLSILKSPTEDNNKATMHGQPNPLHLAAKEGAGEPVRPSSGVRKLPGSAPPARSGIFRKDPLAEPAPAEPRPGSGVRPLPAASSSTSGIFRKPPGEPASGSGQIRRPAPAGGSGDGQTVIRKSPLEPNVMGPDAAAPRAAPRRAGNPVPVLLTVPGGGTEPLQGWVLDRSSGGLRVLIDQQFKPGTMVNVRPTKAHSSFPWIEVDVRSCQPERGSYNIGCQFTRKLTWAELQMFG